MRATDNAAGTCEGTPIMQTQRFGLDPAELVVALGGRSPALSERRIGPQTAAWTVHVSDEGGPFVVKLQILKGFLAIT